MAVGEDKNRWKSLSKLANVKLGKYEMSLEYLFRENGVELKEGKLDIGNNLFVYFEELDKLIKLRQTIKKSGGSDAGG